MEFLDDNHVKGEMSDGDFLLKIHEEEIKRRGQEQRYGRAGTCEVYCERFEYRGVPYLIKILRYFQIGIPLDQSKGMNDIGKWAVVETPDDMKELVDVVDSMSQETGLYEFLYHDSLHGGQEHFTLKKCVEVMHEAAKKDIDLFYDLQSSIQKHVHELIDKYEKRILPLLRSYELKAKVEGGA